MSAADVKKSPFAMTPQQRAVLECDGKFLVSGRASFAWETFLQRRASGVPGAYRIRVAVGRRESRWHDLDWTPEEAEEALAAWHSLPGKGRRDVERCRAIRAARERRGLPVG